MVVPKAHQGLTDLKAYLEGGYKAKASHTLFETQL